MIQAMYSGITGMKAFMSSLNVIGNNIANVNTVAYKSSSVTFRDALSQTLVGASSPSGTGGGTNPSQVGLGVTVGAISTNQTQGSLLSGGSDTDMAIDGNGYFGVSNGTRTFYTRDGSMALDSENCLVTSGTGYRVLGWTADPITGAVDTNQPIDPDSYLEIPVGGLSVARQTSEIGVVGNLDASADTGADYTVQFSIYDSLGVTHDLRIEFSKSTTPAQQDYAVYCDDAGAGPITSGSISFDSKGCSTVSSIPLSIVMAQPNGSDSPLVATIDTSGLSQLNGDNTVDLESQNGLPLGTLESFSVDKTGLITGAFTNGSVRALGQVALVGFSNPAGLERIGNNLLTETANSGVPSVGVAGTAGLGKISAGYLEGSNVDLSTEFANMIVAQRGFQASSRIITASDQILQELVQLAR